MWARVAKCDVCGRIKGEANKWLLVNLSAALFTVYHWDELIARQPNMGHICGEQCLHKKLQEFLDLRNHPPSQPQSQEENTHA